MLKTTYNTVNKIYNQRVTTYLLLLYNIKITIYF